MINGFQKLNNLVKEKNSHIVLGLDPDDLEMLDEITLHGGLEEYLKWLIDETHEFIVGVKPNLAFYELTEERRNIMARVLDYADKKYGLVKILDVKRGDIFSTQEKYAHADDVNFKPDIVTLDVYPGCEDVIRPYLNIDDHMCVYALVATSNPSAKYFQDKISEGIYNYQHMALLARQVDDKRVGFVIGSTQIPAIKNVRAIELEHGYKDNLAPVLAPGFGRQGGSLEFVEYAGSNVVYPISSGLTNKKHLNGKTPKEAAETWRNEINSRINAKPMQSITEMTVDGMIRDNLIWVAKDPNPWTWRLLSKGNEKLKKKEIDIKDLKPSDREQVFFDLLKSGTLDESDLGLIFLEIRNIIGSTETRRLLAYLYAKLIRESKVEYDRIGSVAYGAVNTADLVSYILDKPGVLLRKERGKEANHSDILGPLNEGETTIMLEDVTTSADSLIDASNYLRNTFGTLIKDAFVFCRRTPEGEKKCLDNGIKLHYVTDMTQLERLLAASPLVNPEVKRLILKNKA